MFDWVLNTSLMSIIEGSIDLVRLTVSSRVMTHWLYLPQTNYIYPMQTLCSKASHNNFSKLLSRLYHLAKKLMHSPPIISWCFDHPFVIFLILSLTNICKFIYLCVILSLTNSFHSLSLSYFTLFVLPFSTFFKVYTVHWRCVNIMIPPPRFSMTVHPQVLFVAQTLWKSFVCMGLYLFLMSCGNGMIKLPVVHLFSKGNKQSLC